MPHPIVNINAVEYLPFPGEIPLPLKERYEGAKLGQIGRVVGSQKLGYNVTILPPGKRAFPFHNHHVNEEMFFVIEGSGMVRLGQETYPLVAGDVIACRAGNKDQAHQIINTSDRELKYLAVSTKLSPELAEYPDSNKFGVLTEDFRFLGKAEQSLGYWDGE